jgi:hypothetical protein
MTKGKQGDYEVGYGKPPRSGQFQPGQSGYPRGRKPHNANPEAKLPSFRPTQRLLRSEAKRLIAVRDGDRSYKIPITEAVIRSLTQTALKNGVLAQRTFLSLQQAEDARLAAEQEEVFSSWEDYVAQARKAFELAEANGEPEPDLHPHPSDVILDYDNREVQVIGPRDAKEAERCRINRRKLELFFELMLFFDEVKQQIPSDKHPIYGAFAFLFASILPLLPPRLRSIDDAVSDAVYRRATGMRKDWIAYLNEQFRSVGLDYDVSKMRSRSIDLRDLNLRAGRYGFEHYRWPKRGPSS